MILINVKQTITIIEIRALYRVHHVCHTNWLRQTAFYGDSRFTPCNWFLWIAINIVICYLPALTFSCAICKFVWQNLLLDHKLIDFNQDNLYYKEQCHQWNWYFATFKVHVDESLSELLFLYNDVTYLWHEDTYFKLNFTELQNFMTKIKPIDFKKNFFLLLWFSNKDISL